MTIPKHRLRISFEQLAILGAKILEKQGPVTYEQALAQIKRIKQHRYMTNAERIKANADKGYILVAPFDGWEIYKKQNEVGGWTYYSDQIGYEGAYIIWDTSTRSLEELHAILHDIKGKVTPISVAKDLFAIHRHGEREGEIVYKEKDLLPLLKKWDVPDPDFEGYSNELIK